MEQPGVTENGREIERRRRAIAGLRRSVFERPGGEPEASLLERLAAEEAALAALEGSRAAAAVAGPDEGAPGVPARGRFLGPKTTGLRVEPTLRMQPIPTGVYHLLDPEAEPLVAIAITNESRETRRVCVRVYLEGLSAQAVRTVEVERGKPVTLKLLPSLLPERAAAVTEVQRATLHVIVEDLDGKPESHDTFTVVCLARSSGFNSVRRPGTGEAVDLTHYYGAWVTPHDEAVQAVVRRAADLVPDRRVLGYQGDPEGVVGLVGALYRALKEAGLTYVNSVIDFGAGPGQSTQRTRLPRESLAGRAANCLDGSVLFASLLEGASLSAALVLVPGHALVGWETWDGSDEWEYLETTMIGGHDFEAARQAGRAHYATARKLYLDRVVVHRLDDLRSRGVWPMN